MTKLEDSTASDAVGRPLDLRVVPHEPRTNAALAKTIDTCGYLSTEAHGALTDCCRELERDLEHAQKELGECSAGWETGTKAIAENLVLRAALDQLLDDMGADGHCVCEDAKQQAIAAMRHNVRVEGRR